MTTCRMVERIPAVIREEDAVYCENCHMITEAKFSGSSCFYCGSKAFVALDTWLNRRLENEA